MEQQLSESVGSLGIFAPNEQRSVALSQGDWSVYSQDDEFLSTITNGLLTAPMKPGMYTARSNSEEKRFIVQLQAQERVIEEEQAIRLESFSKMARKKCRKLRLYLG
ncbi:VWFA domain-containing protein OS=Lysinibacillus sphaericus OX=1421 GN=LS41612_18835 PE=4 SV=1 [Lysinibacillus sphaericus]